MDRNQISAMQQTIIVKDKSCHDRICIFEINLLRKNNTIEDMDFCQFQNNIGLCLMCSVSTCCESQQLILTTKNRMLFLPHDTELLLAERKNGLKGKATQEKPQQNKT